MTPRLSSLALVLAVSLFLCGVTSLGVAAQSSSGQGPTPGADPPMTDPCFAQFTDNLQLCRNLFCPSSEDCNETLLAACAHGASLVLAECLENSKS